MASPPTPIPRSEVSAKKLGLKLMGGFDGRDAKKARQQIIEQRDNGTHYMNVQLLDHDTPPAVAAKLAVQLIKLSDELGVGVHIETHRDNRHGNAGKIR